MTLLDISKQGYVLQVGRLPSGKYFCSYGSAADERLEENWFESYEDALEDALFVMSEWENYKYKVCGTTEDRVKRG